MLTGYLILKRTTGFKDDGYFSFPETNVMTGGSLIVRYPSNVFKHMNTPNPSFKS